MLIHHSDMACGEGPHKEGPNRGSQFTTRPQTRNKNWTELCGLLFTCTFTWKTTKVEFWNEKETGFARRQHND